MEKNNEIQNEEEENPDEPLTPRTVLLRPAGTSNASHDAPANPKNPAITVFAKGPEAAL